jgi:hypothetical protein
MGTTRGIVNAGICTAKGNIVKCLRICFEIPESFI